MAMKFYIFLNSARLSQPLYGKYKSGKYAFWLNIVKVQEHARVAAVSYSDVLKGFTETPQKRNVLRQEWKWPFVVVCTVSLFSILFSSLFCKQNGVKPYNFHDVYDKNMFCFGNFI